ncbi:MAG: ABC transporter ATP-binding protein [Anaerolineaceae bacterium]|nr:ABC transporter ATP-binding protein [Anaerolineaceae bacterium]
MSFQYPQNREGLSPVSLNVYPGQHILVRGTSGSGKSTLARCLSGLIPHLYRGEYSGEVRMNGFKSHEVPFWQLAEEVGMVFQNPASQMLALTVEAEILFGLENLGLSRANMKARLEKTLNDFDLVDFRQRSPLKLSGGEQQKVALASIVARMPRTLVLDEPLSMLDTTAAMEFISYLDTYTDQGFAAVICEHRERYLENLPIHSTLDLNGKKAEMKNTETLSKSIGEMAQSFRLKVSNLNVCRNGRQVIKDLDFDIPGGQIVSVVGRNGTGKTTLLRTLIGLQDFSGDVEVFKGERSEKPSFGMVFQNPDFQFFNANVKEEILYRRTNPNQDLYHWLLETLNLTAYELTPPLLISEGEKKRVALATAIMQKPRHGVFLDEPALGQDESHKQVLFKMMRSLANAGYLVMVATHDLEMANQTDHMLVLGNEGIIVQGKPTELLNAATLEPAGIKIPPWMEFSE